MSFIRKKGDSFKEIKKGVFQPIPFHTFTPWNLYGNKKWLDCSKKPWAIFF
jgi:hypothetical protein